MMNNSYLDDDDVDEIEIALTSPLNPNIKPFFVIGKHLENLRKQVQGICKNVNDSNNNTPLDNYNDKENINSNIILKFDTTPKKKRSTVSSNNNIDNTVTTDNIQSITPINNINNDIISLPNNDDENRIVKLENELVSLSTTISSLMKEKEQWYTYY